MSAKLMFSQQFLGKKTAAHKRSTQDSVRSDRIRGKKTAAHKRPTQDSIRSDPVDSTKVNITALSSATMFQRTIHPNRSYSR